MTPSEYNVVLTDILTARKKDGDKINTEVTALAVVMRKVEQQTGAHQDFLKGMAAGIGEQIQIMRNLGVTGTRISDFDDAANVKPLFTEAKRYLASTVADLDRTITASIATVASLKVRVEALRKSLGVDFHQHTKKDAKSREAAKTAHAGLTKIKTTMDECKEALATWEATLAQHRGYAASKATSFNAYLATEFAKTSANREAEAQMEMVEQKLNEAVMKKKLQAAKACCDKLDELQSELALACAAVDPAKRPSLDEIKAIKQKGVVPMKALIEINTSLKKLVGSLKGVGANGFKGSRSEAIYQEIVTLHKKAGGHFKDLMEAGTG